MTPLFSDQQTKPYWDWFGFIAILCRKNDAACPGRYISGVYRFEDGVPLNHLTEQPLVGEKPIDTETFLPILTTGNQD